MKHLSLIIIAFALLFNGNKAQAQHHYIPIPADSAFWISTSTLTEEQSTWYEVVYTDGADTIVAGKYYNGYYSGRYPYLEQQYGHMPTAIENWFRQDTISKKVWEVEDKSGTGPLEYLLYDFSLHVGDTITDTNQNIFYRRRPYKFWVASMDSVHLADSLWHYRWFIHSNYGPDWGFPAAELVQIEGMGYTTGFMDDPLNIYDLGITEYYKICCFQHNGLWLYSQPNPWNADCDSMMNNELSIINLGIKKVPNNDLNLLLLYPNPVAAGGQMTLNSLAGNAWEKHQIIVFNTLGNEVFRRQVKPGQSFTVPRLPAGLYFFKVLNAGGKPIYNAKISIH